jgi:FSR family fosmidomycin resistance protein-like MFS transporter
MEIFFMKLPESTRWFRLFLLLIFIGAAHFLVDTMLGIWPIYKSLAKLDIATAGLIVAVGAFIGEGSQLFFGSFSDKGYRKILIIVGLILAMASSLLPYSSNYVTLFLLYLITCIGSGCFHPCAASLVSGLVPERRGLLMTIFAAGGSLGLATSQLTFTQTQKFFEGHTYLLALPAIGLAFLLACYPFPQVKTPVINRTGLKEIIGFFKIPTLRCLYISQVANQSILWGTIFILPDALKALGHTDWICYGGGHFCFIMGAACMMIPGGFLADLYSARRVMLYGGLISIVAFYFILFSGGVFLPIVLLALFVLGATLALMNPIAVSLGTRLYPSSSGAVSAFLMGLVWCISEALGPGGVGIMSTLFDDYAAVKSLAILGCLFLVQIYATICLPKEVFSLGSLEAPTVN